jgi:hypothetical protein
MDSKVKKEWIMLSDVLMRLGDLNLHNECYNSR